MKKRNVTLLKVVQGALLACVLQAPTEALADAWMDNNPNAIWERAPGVYKEGGTWYVIFHAGPNDTNVKIQGDFTNGANNAVPLERTPDGKFWWFKGTDQSFSRAPQTGDGYRFSVVRNGQTMTFPDPASRWQSTKDINTAMSKIFIGSDQAWSNPNWQRSPAEELNIYQIHAWRFTGRNGGSAFEQVIEELDNDGQGDYINKLGSTAVQFLPLNDFTSDLGWGYNPNYYYAIEQTFGGPVQFKQLVNTAHQNNLDVVMDLVFNHVSHNASPGVLDANTILAAIDRDTYIDGETDWGAMYNFDNDVAKHFLIQNVLYLAKEFRITGFRFDMTNLIWNEDNHHIITKGSGGGWQFLRELYGKVKAYDPNIWFTYEEFPDWYGISANNVDGTTIEGTTHGPTDSQWVDVFHDHFKAVLTGGHLDLLNDVFGHAGEKWGDSTVYAASHDEVGNTDDRIALRGRDGRGWEMNQISGVGTILARGTPMVFMGQEAGEEKQFDINGWSEGDRLNLSDYENNAGRKKILSWFTKMNEIRGADLYEFSAGDSVVTHIHDDNGIAAFTRAGGKYLIVMNFKGNAYQDYDVGVQGNYAEIANTSWAEFNLNNYPETTRGTAAQEITGVHIPPYGAVVLKRADGNTGGGGFAKVFPELTFRNALSDWQPVAMDLVANNIWQATHTFSDGDFFKFDVYGDWATNYGDVEADGTLEQWGDDIAANVTGEYLVEVNDQTLAYRLIPLDPGAGNFAQEFESLYFRGTANAWGATAFELTGDNLWAATINFDGSADQRFKLDIYGDWATNYGDDGANGVLESAGADIYTSVAGEYRIEVNDATLQYSIIPVNPVNVAPVAYAGNDVTVALGQQVVFDGSGSYDSDGSISIYQWDGGLASQVSPAKTFDQAGTFTFNLTVVDNQGASSASDSVTVTVLAPTSTYPSMHVRGTPNAWGATPMTLVGNNTWQAVIYLDGSADQRFKLDVYGDWQTNFGDTNADGVLESFGGDITTNLVGNYVLRVNDSNLQYSLSPAN